MCWQQTNCWMKTVIFARYLGNGLKHFRAMFSFYTPWIYQKISGFLMFPGGMCVFISFHRKGFSWLKQNKCNARDQTSDVVLRKLLCVIYLHHHVIDNHSRDLQASNCTRVSIKPGRATRSKRQLLKLSKNQQ